jgi:hypothetical protein
MSTEFERVASSNASWQTGSDLASHTLLQDRAERTVKAYIRIVSKLAGPKALAGSAIDLGAGAGFIAKAFRSSGIDMVASEHTTEGIALLRRINPDIPARQDNISTFNEPGCHSLLVARELYPFTRVNAFSEQFACIGRLLDSLSTGGALILVGSDVSAPHCLDMHLVARSLRRDARVANIGGPWLESVLIRSGMRAGSKFWMGFADVALKPYVAWMRRKRWAAIRVLVVTKL